jgi:hypothetical protein
MDRQPFGSAQLPRSVEGPDAATAEAAAALPLVIGYFPEQTAHPTKTNAYFGYIFRRKTSRPGKSPNTRRELLLESRCYLQFEVAGPTGKGGRGAALLNWPTWRCGLMVATRGLGEA